MVVKRIIFMLYLILVLIVDSLCSFFFLSGWLVCIIIFIKKGVFIWLLLVRRDC